VTLRSDSGEPMEISPNLEEMPAYGIVSDGMQTDETDDSAPEPNNSSESAN